MLMAASGTPRARTLAIKVVARSNRKGTNDASDVAARYVLGEITHDQMMNDLTHRRYELGQVHGIDGYSRGTYDQLLFARNAGLLSPEDFDRISAASAA